MDSKDIDAVYNLMQNVSDKLSNISTQIETNNQNKDEPQIQKVLERQEAIAEYLVSLDKENKKTNKASVQHVKNHTEYVLFGKDSTMNSRLFFVLASLIIIIWLGFKYLAPVITKQEALKTENKNYKMMHDYLYLKNIRHETSTVPIDQLLNNIKNNDPHFIKEFSYMLEQHKKSERRIELENELKKLK